MPFPWTASSRAFDITLFGCTGYTGRLAANYLAQTCGQENIKWSLAGRNRSKLEALAADLRLKHKLEENEVNLQTVTTDDDLIKMTNQTQVLITMVGPYLKHGYRVVEACVESGTHYVDITAELTFVEKIKEAFNDKAAEKHLKIVPCCGFDFVPNDMMMYQILKLLESERPDLLPLQSKAPLCVSHMFHQSTPMVSGGTALSGMEIMRSKRLPDLVSYFVDPYALCYNRKAGDKVPGWVKHQNSLQLLPSYCPEVKAYCVPYVMTSLMHKYVHWSNELQGYPWGANLVYLGGEFRQSMIAAYFFSFLLWIEFITFALVSHFDPRYWKYVLPSPGEGPAIKEETAFAESILIATGAGLPDSESIVIKWRMQKAEAYVLAGAFACETAKCMVKSNESCPKSFGVLSPSAALGDAYLDRIKRIDKLNITTEFKTSV